MPTTPQPTTATEFPHAYYCKPQPGEAGPRMETYPVPRFNEAGAQVATSQALRCIECGELTYDGQDLHGGTLPILKV